MLRWQTKGIFREMIMIFSVVLGLLHLLTVVSDRIGTTFNTCGSAVAVSLDICKAFDRVWHAGLLGKRRFYGILGQVFDLISSFLNSRRLRVGLNGKSLQ